MSPSRIVRPRATTAAVAATVTAGRILPVRDVAGRATAVAGPPGERAEAPGTSGAGARADTGVGATTTVAARAVTGPRGTGRAAVPADARTATVATGLAAPVTPGAATAPSVGVPGASVATRRVVPGGSTAQAVTTALVLATVTAGRARGVTVRTVRHGVATRVGVASTATPRAGAGDRGDRATIAAAVTVPAVSAGVTPRAPGRVATARASTDVLSLGTLPARTCPRTCRSPSSTAQRAAGSGR